MRPLPFACVQMGSAIEFEGSKFGVKNGPCTCRDRYQYPCRVGQSCIWHAVLFWKPLSECFPSHHTILSHDPMTGVAMVTVRRLWLKNHFASCRQKHGSEGLGLVLSFHDVLGGIGMAHMRFTLSWWHFHIRMTQNVCRFHVFDIKSTFF